MTSSVLQEPQLLCSGVLLSLRSEPCADTVEVATARSHDTSQICSRTAQGLHLPRMSRFATSRRARLHWLPGKSEITFLAGRLCSLIERHTIAHAFAAESDKEADPWSSLSLSCGSTATHYNGHLFLHWQKYHRSCAPASATWSRSDT